MKMDEIRLHAENVGIKPAKLNKTQLVRTIQLQEGNFDCFASATDGNCDQWTCVWREDCFTTAMKKPATEKKAKSAKKPASKQKASTEKKPASKKKASTKKKATPKKKTKTAK